MQKYTLAGNLLFAIILSFLAGCGAESVKTPETTVMGIKNLQVKGLGSNAVLSLRLSNINPDKILVEGLKVKLYINNNSFAKAMDKIDKPLAGYSTLDIELPATISNLTIMQTALALSKNKKIAYRLNAEITFRSAENKRYTRSIQDKGSMDIASLLRRQ